MAFKCPVCSKTFARRQTLREHSLLHSGQALPWPCSHCPKGYLRRQELIIHENTHLGIRPFKCTLCPKTFAQHPHLRSHLRIHTGEKPFKCPQCPKTFTQSSHLRTHESHHTGEKPWKCPHCPDRFRLASTLKCHLRRHTGEKPYKCHICGMAFSQTTPLYHHLQKHTGELQWVCKLCPKRFLTKRIRNDHEKTCKAGGSRKWVCMFCNDRRYTSDDMTKHYRMHIGERPYSCKFCDLDFLTSYAMKYHMRIHVDGVLGRRKNYQCDKCHHSFQERTRYERHLSQNHPETEERKVSDEDVVVKQFKCLHCPLSFDTRDEIRDHNIKTHLMQKMMKSGRRHDKNVGEGKRWQCDECTAWYKDETGLKMHAKLAHAGLEEVKCGFCWKRFPTVEMRRRHWEKEHTEQVKNKSDDPVDERNKAHGEIILKEDGAGGRQHKKLLTMTPGEKDPGGDAKNELEDMILGRNNSAKINAVSQSERRAQSHSNDNDKPWKDRIQLSRRCRVWI